MSGEASRSFVLWARNNAWANHRLLTACTHLRAGALEAERTGVFPSLLLTLNHNLTVDLFYVDALEGGDLGHAAFDDPTPCRTIGDLLAAQAAVDRRLLVVCQALSEERLADEVRVHRPDRVQVERTDRLLMHLVQHQIHHRGQAHAMLAGTSVPPPQLDEFFSAGEAPLRAGALAALGWTEAEIWA